MREQINQLFAKFDVDNSGALDVNELVDLYNVNNVMVDEMMIKQMYGGDIKFTA